jgi:hypothetical protein
MGFNKKSSPKGAERNNMKISNMSELKEKAIVVTEGMETFFPQFAIRKSMIVSELQAESLTYAYNNSVVAFVDNEGTFYVIPDLKGTQKVLVEAGYRKAYFYVPFSNWDYPVEYKERWEKLWETRIGQE